jgi:hypothetical protein
MDILDLVALSMRLADTPCGTIKHDSPTRLVRELIGASAHWT